MVSRLRAHLTYANVMATLAVFLGLGGGAYALSPQATVASSSSVPSGAVVFFKKHACPPGWSAYGAARGRYLVGVQSGGDLAAKVGTSLSNVENRPTGQLTISPSASTVSPSAATGTWGFDATPASGVVRRPLFGFRPVDSVGSPDVSVVNPFTVHINPITVGSVPGTNAPYVQLLACKTS
jgi:hypothetical protein